MTKDDRGLGGKTGTKRKNERIKRRLIGKRWSLLNESAENSGDELECT
jgi:hypothetical protein